MNFRFKNLFKRLETYIFSPGLSYRFYRVTKLPRKPTERRKVRKFGKLPNSEKSGNFNSLSKIWKSQGIR